MNQVPEQAAFARARDEAPRGVSRGSAWAALSTRARLILVVVAIDAIAAVVSCGVIVLNARTAVQVEMNATLANVEPLVADTIRTVRMPSAEALLHTLDLRFQTMRHVRVAVLDAAGSRVGFAPPDRRRDMHEAPDWFAGLIAPAAQRHEVPIVDRGSRIGTAVITTEPRDEIDEVWGYAVSLALASLLLNLAVVVALFLAFGRVLKPLGGLAEGLSQLEHHDYTARLEPPTSRELAVIAGRFNSVAGALSEARAANGRLKRQLLTAQDDERRNTALELHDEFGPCLFALEANAASVGRIANGAADIDRARLAARASDIAGIVGQVQVLNRQLLNRLRPHALGEVPLADCLRLLVREFGRRHPGSAFEGTFAGLADGYGELVDLTVFRCVQESMTNAVRHGAAAHVRAEVHETDAAPAPDGTGSRMLRVTVRDDGTGLAADHRVGLGLSGMRERVEALDGSLSLHEAAPGTIVRIAIPIEADRPPETGATAGLPT